MYQVFAFESSCNCSSVAITKCRLSCTRMSARRKLFVRWSSSMRKSNDVGSFGRHRWRFWLTALSREGIRGSPSHGSSPKPSIIALLTTAVAGLKISCIPFSLAAAMTFVAVSRPATAGWLCGREPGMNSPSLSFTDAVHGFVFGRWVQTQ